MRHGNRVLESGFPGQLPPTARLRMRWKRWSNGFKASRSENGAPNHQQNPVDPIVRRLRMAAGVSHEALATADQRRLVAGAGEGAELGSRVSPLIRVTKIVLTVVPSTGDMKDVLAKKRNLPRSPLSEAPGWYFNVFPAFFDPIHLPHGRRAGHARCAGRIPNPGARRGSVAGSGFHLGES